MDDKLGRLRSGSLLSPPLRRPSPLPPTHLNCSAFTVACPIIPIAPGLIACRLTRRVGDNTPYPRRRRVVLARRKSEMNSQGKFIFRSRFGFHQIAWFYSLPMVFGAGRARDTPSFRGERLASMCPMNNNPKWDRTNAPTARMQNAKPSRMSNWMNLRIMVFGVRLWGANHSALSAIIGSTFVARRAGNQQAHFVGHLRIDFLPAKERNKFAHSFHR